MSEEWNADIQRINGRTSNILISSIQFTKSFKSGKTLKTPLNTSEISLFNTSG
jgi:flagellar basal body P-ring protein FlgI